MGVDYSAVAGYGVYVKDNLTEEGEKILEDCDGCYHTFMERAFDVSYEYIGCCYSGDSEPVLLFSDPLGNISDYHEWVDKVSGYDNLLKDTSPQWICKLYIY